MKGSPITVENAQRWATIAQDLRPMLAEHDFEPAAVEHALAAAKGVHELHMLNLECVYVAKSRKERAAWEAIGGIVNTATSFYQRATISLLFEVALREARLHHCSCGAPQGMHAKPSAPPRAGEDVLRV